MKKIFLSASALLLITGANAQQRTPLFEVFTSSTCGPCNPGNATYEGVVSAHPATDYVSVKYQQNFPGSGDPYSTNETVSRRSSYYAINSIPRMEIDGGWDKNAQSFTEALYTQYRGVAAKYSIAGTYSIKNKVVTVKVKYTALAALANVKLYVAIVESQTVKNVKSNGETKFFNVVKKMLPDQNGTSLAALPINGKDSTSLTFTFAGNYKLPTDGQTASHINDLTENSVEDFTKLKVVAWVQGSDKSVYNAANLSQVPPLAIGDVSSTVGSMTSFPNPASTTIKVDVNMKQADQVQASLVNMAGAVVATKSVTFQAGQNQISFDATEVANGVYNLVVLDSKSNSFTQRVVVTH